MTTTNETTPKGPAITPRSAHRLQFDGWAGKIAAKALDKAHGMFAGKLSEKMYDAYKMGRRHARKDVAALREALEWYAEGCPTGADPKTGEAISFEYDVGSRARKAIDELGALASDDADADEVHVLAKGLVDALWTTPLDGNAKHYVLKLAELVGRPEEARAQRYVGADRPAIDEKGGV